MIPETGSALLLDIAVDLVTEDPADLADGDFKAWVRATLQAADAPLSGSLAIRLVGSAEGEQLNRQWRDKPGPTNVLAFPGPEPARLPAGLPPELGDLVICLPLVVSEAREQGKSPLAHLTHLVVHGTLHLLGHTHEEDGDAARMEALESLVLAGLGLPDPYSVKPPATARAVK